jgi:hypothetical protein
MLNIWSNVSDVWLTLATTWGSRANLIRRGTVLLNIFIFFYQNGGMFTPTPPRIFFQNGGMFTLTPPRGVRCRERDQLDMDISGVYLTYGEGDTRPRSSRVKSARQGRLKAQSVRETFSELSTLNSSRVLLASVSARVSDPHWFEAGPDPAFSYCGSGSRYLRWIWW